jgi:hypothetical protein
MKHPIPVKILFKPLKQELDIVLDLELLEEVYVFFLERLFAVMLFLVQDVVVHTFDL